MLRDIGATLAGLAVSIGVIMTVQMIGHSIWPPPAGLDLRFVLMVTRINGEVVRTYTSQLPFLALLFPIASYFLGALAGPFVACRIGTTRPLVFIGVICLVLLASTIANLIQIPHPLWFAVLAVAAIIIGGWLALQLAGRD